MKKFRKISLLLAAAPIISATTIFASCANNNNKDELNQTNIDSKTNGFNTNVNASSYVTVSFDNGGDTSITFKGQTISKIKYGYPFAAVVTPTPMKPFNKFKAWHIGSVTGEEITPATKITANTVVVPEMVPDTINFVIHSKDEVYSGFSNVEIAEADWDKELFYVTDATTGEKIPYDSVQWEFINNDDDQPIGTDIIELVKDGDQTSQYKAKVGFIDEIINCTIKVTFGDQVLTKPLKILPPYAVGKLYAGAEYPAFPAGDKFWFAGNPDEASPWGDKKIWIYAEPETICAEEGRIKIATFDELGVGKIELRSEIEREDQDYVPYFDEIVSGLNINTVNDNFMANVTYFNGILNSGVTEDESIKEFNYIGNGFLAGCVNYNQDMTDLFTVLGSLAIGNDFMSGCTAFNNGGATFKLPNATFIGDSFMNDCTGLSGEITISEKTSYIGDNFMNGCEGISKVTFPSYASNKLEFVGPSFLFNCTSLSEIVVNCDNINFMFDKQSQSVDQKASFAKIITSPISEDAQETSSLNIKVSGNAAGCTDLVSTYLKWYAFDETAQFGYYRNLDYSFTINFNISNADISDWYIPNETSRQPTLLARYYIECPKDMENFDPLEIEFKKCTISNPNDSSDFEEIPLDKYSIEWNDTKKAYCLFAPMELLGKLRGTSSFRGDNTVTDVLELDYTFGGQTGHFKKNIQVTPLSYINMSNNDTIESLDETHYKVSLTVSVMLIKTLVGDDYNPATDITFNSLTVTDPNFASGDSSKITLDTSSIQWSDKMTADLNMVFPKENSESIINALCNNYDTRITLNIKSEVLYSQLPSMNCVCVNFNAWEPRD